METWFIAAVAGAVFAGLSNFFFKIAAAKGYSALLFTFYSALTSIVLVGAALVIYEQTTIGFGHIALLVFLAGSFSAVTNILKVHALRHIDSTIYFPLFKLLAPTLAIIAGVTLFAESFTLLEWVGMVLGLLVPLLLITKSENHRQNNLVRGLLLVLITGTLSAVVAVIQKYSIDLGVPAVVTLWYITIGIGAGTIGGFFWQYGRKAVISSLKRDTSTPLFVAAGLRGALISVGVMLILYAFESGGTLAVVQTIHSMYILIPVVLAIIFYHEHWNLQKVAAIGLSVAALALLG